MTVGISSLILELRRQRRKKSREEGEKMGTRYEGTKLA
jgi:hypothetical protein